MKKKTNKPNKNKKNDDKVLKNLNIKQEKFCHLYTKNSYLFGNGTLCYAQAYGFDLEKLSKEAVYKEELVNKETGETKNVRIDDSEYDKACHVCQVNATRLLCNAVINQRISDLLASSLTDEEVDAEISWVIRQRTDLSPKIQGIKEYNKMKGRVTEKKELEIKGLSLKSLYELSKNDDEDDE